MRTDGLPQRSNLNVFDFLAKKYHFWRYKRVNNPIFYHNFCNQKITFYTLDDFRTLPNSSADGFYF